MPRLKRNYWHANGTSFLSYWSFSREFFRAVILCWIEAHLIYLSYAQIYLDPSFQPLSCLSLTPYSCKLVYCTVFLPSVLAEGISTQKNSHNFAAVIKTVQGPEKAFHFVLKNTPLIICFSLQLSPTDKNLEFDRDFRIRHYAGDVT